MPKQNKLTFSFARKYQQEYDFLITLQDQYENISNFVCEAIREKIERENSNQTPCKIVEYQPKKKYNEDNDLLSAASMFDLD